MIVKSLSRHSRSFDQLVCYIDHGAGEHDYYLAHNFLALPNDTAAVVKQFQDNADYLVDSPGSVYMYHEMISLPAECAELDNADEILAGLVQQWINRRCPGHLVYARIHRERCPHVHLAISANPVQNIRRQRLSKKQFREIQVDLENYRLQHYPELGKQRLYQQIGRHEQIRQTDAEIQLQKRTGKITEKQRVTQIVSEALDIAITPAELHQQVKAKGLQFYQRGKTVGVIQSATGRKFRLKTLGLAARYQKLQQMMQVVERQWRELERMQSRQ